MKLFRQPLSHLEKCNKMKWSVWLRFFYNYINNFNIKVLFWNLK